LEGVKPEDRVYLDEMGNTLNMAPTQGRSPRGERVYDAQPTAPGGTINTLAVLTESGVKAVDLYRGSLTAERFVFYIGMYLIPILVGGKVLIMDNHPVHRSKRVVEFLEAWNILYIYLPPYSPELNPIEEVFAKAKHQIRKQKPREPGELASAVDNAIKSITAEDIIGYYNHAEELLDVTF
jgi:transposase